VTSSLLQPLWKVFSAELILHRGFILAAADRRPDRDAARLGGFRLIRGLPLPYLVCIEMEQQVMHGEKLLARRQRQNFLSVRA